LPALSSFDEDGSMFADASMFYVHACLCIWSIIFHVFI
jgi:hypothetical protein